MDDENLYMLKSSHKCGPWLIISQFSLIEFDACLMVNNKIKRVDTETL